MSGIRFAEKLMPNDKVNETLRVSMTALNEIALEDSDTLQMKMKVIWTTTGDKPTGEAVVMPQFPDNIPMEVKQRAMYEIGLRFCRQVNGIPFVITFVSDNWYSAFPPGEEQFSIKNNPDAREALLVIVATIDGRVAWYFAPYDRDQHNRRAVIQDDVQVQYVSQGSLIASEIDVKTGNQINVPLVSAFYSGVIDFIESLGGEEPAKFDDDVQTLWLDLDGEDDDDE